MENIVRKGEIACNKQFLLSSQCFPPCVALVFHFEYTLKCRLQFVSIWTSLIFYHLVKSCSLPTELQEFDPWHAKMTPFVNISTA